MRLRRRYVPLVALLGVATAVLPTIASSETSPSVTAEDLGGVYGEEHHWTPSQVAVGAGGTVSFANPTETRHGVRWINPPATPACDSGVPVGSTESASGTKWSGTCTFSQAGAYTYYCTVHGAAMSGTITVSSSATTTTAVTPSTTTSTGTTSVPTAESSPPPPAGELSLRSSQHGTSVRGALVVSQAGAGGRLEVDLLARGASLASARHLALTRVGRFVRESTSAGRQSFAVKLNTRAIRALKRHRRLALTVKITLVPVHGVATTLIRAVVVHP
jgi:plastocyanin